MSYRTILLIVALIIVTGILLAIALPQQKTTAPVKTMQKVIPTPTPAAKTTLNLMPNPLALSSSSGTIDIEINTQNDVTAVQLELSYDPKILTNVEIEPGTFFENPMILLNNIDSEKGKITYAIAIPPVGTAKKGVGKIAEISFNSNLIQGQKTEITVLPKTLVTAAGIAPSVLKSAQGTTITFGTITTSPVNQQPLNP